MANINENGKFIGRRTKDGEKEFEQKWNYDREHAETPILHIIRFVIWSVAFLIFDAITINFIGWLIFSILVKFFNFDDMNLMYIVGYAPVLLNGFAQHINNWTYIENTKDLGLYTVWAAIATTIASIITLATSVLFVYIWREIKSNIIIMMCIPICIAGIGLIVYSWIVYKNDGV